MSHADKLKRQQATNMEIGLARIAEVSALKTILVGMRCFNQEGREQIEKVCDGITDSIHAEIKIRPEERAC